MAMGSRDLNCSGEQLTLTFTVMDVEIQLNYSNYVNRATLYTVFCLLLNDEPQVALLVCLVCNTER